MERTLPDRMARSLAVSISDTRLAIREAMDTGAPSEHVDELRATLDDYVGAREIWLNLKRDQEQHRRRQELTHGVREVPEDEG